MTWQDTDYGRKHPQRLEIETQWPGCPGSGCPSICMMIPAERFADAGQLEQCLRTALLQKRGAKWIFEVGLGIEELVSIIHRAVTDEAALRG